jgi:Gpi18-like mannosyltransferase
MHIETTKLQTGDRGQVWKRGIWYAFRMFLALRIGIFAWMILLSLIGGRTISEPDVLCKSSALLESNINLGVVLSPWLRWDTICYLIIAETGYTIHPGLTVWPPFYPSLIRLFSFLFTPPLLAALVISSLATWLAFFLLYILITERHDEATAKNTLFLYTVYPLAFFLIAGYTESLFLALVVASLLLAPKKAWGWAGILAALATLTRFQGIALSVVLLWEGILQYREAQGLPGKEIFNVLFAASLPVLTFGAFALYVHNGLHAGWPWQTLATLWGQYTGFPWEGILGNIKQVRTLPVSADLYWLPTNVLDLFLAILIPVIFVIHRRSIRSTYLVFAWLILIISLMKLGPDHTLVSFSRYMLVAFPFFIAIAPVMAGRYLRLIVFGICLILQAILVGMFYIWSWAG